MRKNDEKYKYTGKEKDITGLYYFGARYYDSTIGRFITRDPVKGNIMNPQTLNALPLPTYEVYNCVTTTFS